MRKFLFAIVEEGVSYLIRSEGAMLNYVEHRSNGHDFEERKTKDKTRRFYFCVDDEERELIFYPCVDYDLNDDQIDRRDVPSNDGTLIGTLPSTDVIDFFTSNV